MRPLLPKEESEDMSHRDPHTRRRRRFYSPPLLLAALTALVTALITSMGATAEPSASPPVNTAPPTASGQAAVGQVVIANSGSWSGTTPIAFGYQWLRCDAAGGACFEITSATGQSYAITTADIGRRLRVRVTATNADGTATAISDPSAVVTAAATAPTNASLPAISGTQRQGSTLTATNGGWNGNPSPSYKYQWGRCDSNGNSCAFIPGATGQSYTLTKDDVGKRLRVRVTATNSAGSAEALSGPTGTIAALGTAPANTGAPSLSGGAVEGQVLRLAVGTWSGTAPITYTYQWQRCDVNGNACANIAGATGTSWTLTAASIGHRIRAIVTASNAVGKSTTTTGPSAVVVSAGPAGAIKLPSGETSIPVTSVPTSERLVVSKIEYTPSVVRSRNSIETARYRVRDTRGYVVRDALVLATPLPYVWASSPAETRSGTDGWATVQFRVRSIVPKKSAIVVFVRARKPGGSVLAGVSSRRLTQVLVDVR